MIRHWVVALRDPVVWRDSVVALLERVWVEVYAFTWRNAAAALSRELDAVARSGAAGHVEHLLDHVHADLAARPGILRVRPRPGTSGGEFDRRGRPLVVLPMAVGPDNLLRNFVDEHESLVGYTPRAVARLLSGERGASARVARDELGALVGPARAGVLRALRGTVTAGALASEIGCPPNVLSYHLRRLEESGLVARERVGQHVLVRRSARGEGLLDLYS